jgi:hypothetical protein
MNQSESKSDTVLKNKINFDLFGIVRMRLENPTEDDIESMKKQIGFEPSEFEYEPDIIIRFTPDLVTPDFAFLDINSAGFTKDDFYLISSEKPYKKIKIPFEKIGSKIEIVCEHGVKSIPLLNHLINFTFLGKNYLPLHSSGLSFNGKGMLIMGWAHGGKTSALMSFAMHGANYVGDDWVILYPKENLMYGLPLPISIKEWQFSQIPKLLPKKNAKQKMIFGIIHSLDFVYKYASKIGMNKIALINLLGDVLPTLKKQLKVQISPGKIFGDRIQKNGTPLNFVLLTLSHGSEEIRIEECDWKEVVDRMINSNKFEQISMFKFYEVFKFAFPNRKNEFLENSVQLQHQLLTEALMNKKSYKVSHPYPVEFEKLYSQLNQTIFESKEFKQEKSINIIN